MPLPTYDIDLKDLKKTESPEGNRLTSQQNFDELEKYIKLVVDYVRSLQLGGVDIDAITDAVRAKLKRVCTIPASLQDGTAIQDPTSGLVVSRVGNSYIISVEDAYKTISEIKSLLDDKIPVVDIIKRDQELEYSFFVPITNDFQVTII